jgi:hypothetical protein
MILFWLIVVNLVLAGVAGGVVYGRIARGWLPLIAQALIRQDGWLGRPGPDIREAHAPPVSGRRFGRGPLRAFACFPSGLARPNLQRSGTPGAAGAGPDPGFRSVLWSPSI